MTKVIRSNNTLLCQLRKKIHYFHYRGGKCQRCGDSRVYVMELHHDPPRSKEIEYSSSIWTRSWESIKLIGDPLIMLCSSCHSEAHFLTGAIYQRGIYAQAQKEFMESSESRRSKAPSGARGYYTTERTRKLWNREAPSPNL